MTHEAIARPDFSTANILVVGDAMLDQYWFGDVDRVSPEAPVPVVLVKREEYRLGGAANVALNVATLGGKATLLSVVGRDPAAARMRDMLDGAGIAHDLQDDDSVQTTLKLRVSGRAQQLLRIDFENRPNADMLDVLAGAMERHVAAHRVVILSDYGKGCLGRVERKIDIARRIGRPVLIDPKGRDWEIYRGRPCSRPIGRNLFRWLGPGATMRSFKTRHRHCARGWRWTRCW
ncbi:bifunctional heptose 7-phosphate kinase/heptose 1-phosphate adenyltransferase [Sphingomonas changnyeongensis]|uniref:bifunctional heptose 7-phosphate kinase/heptose 1-phosphate adenyltransferase n=1 Tax=Sphingomonas changnyeongensis TaxID=2698679 RepID=UPI00228687CE|nr:PfkB family carbohydrate kinase [Sphingomonas changnyeongensis]